VNAPFVSPMPPKNDNGGPPLDDDAVIDHLRRRCESDFRFFVRYFFKHRNASKFIFHEELHGVICDTLMDVYCGDVQNVIFNMPPRYGKTELIVILFVAWCYVKNRNCEFLHLSFSAELVLQNSDAIREIIHSPEFKQLWPDVRIRPSKDAKKLWEIEDGGSFYAAPAAGTVTGMGAGRTDEMATGEFVFSGALIIDDPLKPDDANSDTERKKVNNRWAGTIRSRRNSPKSTPVICVMQRLHLEDFTATLLADGELRFKHVSLPAILDRGKPTERALWPFKHDLPTLKRMENAATAKERYEHASQYNQTPIVFGGNVIKGEWFVRVRVLPKMKWRCIYVDTAMKAKEANDYSVFTEAGKGEDGKCYILHVRRGKWEAPALERNACDEWDRAVARDVSQWGKLRKMKVEDKASGTGLIQKLKTGMPDSFGKPTRALIPVQGIERSTDKYSRVNDIAGFIETGYVAFLEGEPWAAEFVSECEAFTPNDTHAYDDQVDTMADAIDDILGAKPRGFFG
jgi:predicted phage terminase large subunit-like protein